MLRVGFDGRDLLRKRTGVVNYAVHLSASLSRQKEAEFVVYADSFHDPLVDPPATVSLRRLGGPPVAWKHLALPFALARDRVRLFHSPTGTLPFIAPCRQVVTIHDLFADISPEWFAPRVGRQLQITQRRAAARANAVIAVSERTRQDLLRLYRLPPERVHVVANGVDHARFHVAQAGAAEQAVMQKYSLEPPFVICVGSLMPWRNASTLLRAVAVVREQHGIELGLLYVGRDIWGTDPTRRLAAEHAWDNWVRFADYVPDEELAPLYRTAALCAVPSLDEGFGIPPLEAMAVGTPVVASAAGALPEVLGDAALFFDPRSDSEIAGALWRVLDDGAVADAMRKRGLEQAARYRWERAAQETWRVYERALA